jgi:rod shape determining protein RodA
MKIGRMIHRLDVPLLLFVLMLAVISIVAISGATYSTNPSFVQQQVYWYILGILLMGVTLLFDYRVLAQGRFVYLVYGLGLFLLLLVLIPGIGVSIKGAQRWVNLFGVQFLPSEFMKLFLIVTLAKVTAEFQRIPVRSWRELGKLIALFLVPFFLILKQPDLGTSLVLVGILVSVMLAGGVDWRIFAVGLIVVGIAVGTVFLLFFMQHPLLHAILEEHQIQRIETFVNPASDPTGAGYQLTQSMIAIGSGQLDGKGFQQGTQAQGRWLPEPHNDFIFAVFAEEFGFIGGSILLCLFLFLIYRMVQVGIRCEDRFGACLVAGVIGMIVFQVFQNIGMTVGLLPVTGLPLPFISYGGSALIANLVAVGLVLNVGMRQGGNNWFAD